MKIIKNYIKNFSDLRAIFRFFSVKNNALLFFSFTILPLTFYTMYALRPPLLCGYIFPSHIEHRTLQIKYASRPPRSENVILSLPLSTFHLSLLCGYIFPSYIASAAAETLQIKYALRPPCSENVILSLLLSTFHLSLLCGYIFPSYIASAAAETLQIKYALRPPRRCGKIINSKFLHRSQLVPMYRELTRDLIFNS